MKWVYSVLTAMVALLLGGILAEGFLRLLIPVEVQFETWFTPGLEKWDDEFGSVYRPNWAGTMRHVDGVYRGVPLQLDEHGFRLPIHNGLSGEPKKILLMGGRSAMMSYGLNDAETVHARLAASLPFPAEVHSIPSAGGNLLRDWIQYRRHLSERHYDLVIISHVNPYLPAYKDHAAFDQLPAPPPPEWVFHYMDGIVLWRDGLFLKTGRAAFQSYLGYGFVRIADTFLKRLKEKETGGPGGLAQVISKQSQAPDPIGLADYGVFLAHLENHFTSKGTPVLLHLIPRPFAEASHHAPFFEAFSPEMDVVDMNARLSPEITGEMFIANGHYGPRLAQMLGEALAEEVSARIITENP